MPQQRRTNSATASSPPSVSSAASSTPAAAPRGGLLLLAFLLFGLFDLATDNLGLGRTGLGTLCAGFVFFNRPESKNALTLAVNERVIAAFKEGDAKPDDPMAVLDEAIAFIAAGIDALQARD